MAIEEPELSRYRGGSPECMEQNLEYFIKKLKEENDNKTKRTFRDWTKRFLNLLDLID